MRGFKIRGMLSRGITRGGLLMFVLQEKCVSRGCTGCVGCFGKADVAGRSVGCVLTMGGVRGLPCGCGLAGIKVIVRHLRPCRFRRGDVFGFVLLRCLLSRRGRGRGYVVLVSRLSSEAIRD